MAASYFDIGRLKPGEVVLDYGCGDGWFLEACAERQVTPIGFEMSPIQAASLSSRLKLPVYSDPKLLLSEFQAKIDLVTMHSAEVH